MVLHIHSDAPYSAAPEARSRIGGLFFSALHHKTCINHCQDQCHAMSLCITCARLMFELEKDKFLFNTLVARKAYPKPPTDVGFDIKVLSSPPVQT
eukprot:14949944-Ditylum_brightwellii.AAC.1